MTGVKRKVRTAMPLVSQKNLLVMNQVARGETCARAGKAEGGLLVKWCSSRLHTTASR